MILLIGSKGYVGQAYQAYFKRRGLPYICVERYWTDSEMLLQLFLENTMTRLGNEEVFVINAAGYTGKPNVDACELHKADCLYGNAYFPGLIARVCKRLNIKWGHVSSGCIFTGNGTEGGPFEEIDTPNFTFRTNNCSYYSGTKALGEEILADYDNVYIWRLRIPFNNVNSPRNYLSKLMVYDILLDATNSISQLDEFVEATYACYEKQISTGIYNVTNPGVVTTREVVDLIKKAGVSDKEYRFFASEAEFNRLVKAPRSNCVLSSAKLASYDINLTEVHLAIETALFNWQK